MSLPASSAERNALVPVIATLLQLSSTELSAVQAAMKGSLWASLPVHTVKPRIISNNNSAHGKLVDNVVATAHSTSVNETLASQILTDNSVSASVAHSTRLYSPPTLLSKHKDQHPMLSRSDTVENNLGIDLGPVDTPEIHM